MTDHTTTAPDAGAHRVPASPRTLIAEAAAAGASGVAAGASGVDTYLLASIAADLRNLAGRVDRAERTAAAVLDQLGPLVNQLGQSKLLRMLGI